MEEHGMRKPREGERTQNGMNYEPASRLMNPLTVTNAAQMLSSTDKLVVYKTLQELRKLPRESLMPIVDSLIQCLDHDAMEVRWEAMQCLEKMPEDILCRIAIGIVKELPQSDADGHVRRAALLRRLGDGEGADEQMDVAEELRAEDREIGKARSREHLQDRASSSSQQGGSSSGAS
jgi:hypothetical protein